MQHIVTGAGLLATVEVSGEKKSRGERRVFQYLTRRIYKQVLGQSILKWGAQY